MQQLGELPAGTATRNFQVRGRRLHRRPGFRHPPRGYEEAAGIGGSIMPAEITRVLAQHDTPARTQIVQTWRDDNAYHVISLTYVESKFAKHAILFANSLSLQSGPAVTTLLGIARAPTSVVRGRAQKNVRSRAQGDVASSEKSRILRLCLASLLSGSRLTRPASLLSRSAVSRYPRGRR